MDTKRIRNVDISQIHHLPMIDFIGNDFAIFKDIKDMPLSSYPTRLNAACLTVCLKGWCKLELNLQQCEMREGMLGIILPDQIVLQRERSDDFSGLFIAVSRDFMDMVIPTMQQLFPMFFMIKERPFVHITPEESQSFQEYHSFLWSKVKLKDNPFRKEKRSVSYYADKMFLTAKHLSTVVKEISGKTAGEWIDSLVVLEAKALLKSSELSIQEIADELHFANQSFFGKYFKHHTGMSPKEYRRQ